MSHRHVTNVEAHDMRVKAGLNQTQFWSRVGITQSGGSRYETGSCGIPEPVAMLLDLVYSSKGPKLLEKLRSGK
jgi:DNA-binding transcriptional regulator YiaG